MKECMMRNLNEKFNNARTRLDNILGHTHWTMLGDSLCNDIWASQGDDLWSSLETGLTDSLSASIKQRVKNDEGAHDA